jgi:hypothetical protein
MRQRAESEIVEQSRRIDFYLTEYSVEILALKVRSGDFFVPSYQREFTWEDARKSRFIESVIMGLPIPFLFFWEAEDGRLEIVDGSQRLRTLEEFVLGDFRLGDLEALPTISGFRFTDLLESRQRKLRNRSIRGIVLNEHADEQARFDMFERINTSSKAANKAEIRRGALQGPFMDLVIEMSALPTFGRLAPMSKRQQDEREREELVARFFAFGSGLEGYRDRPSEFVFNFVKRKNAEAAADPEILDRYRRRFVRMLTFVEAAFPEGFRRSVGGKSTPRARFEAIALGSIRAMRDRPSIRHNPPDASAWALGSAFNNIAGGDGANAIRRLNGRIDFVRDRLLGL